MKRRQFLKGAGLAAASTAIAAPAIAQSMPEIKWRLASSFPKSLDTLYGAAEIFAKAVAEATDNKFQIQVFAGGEIVPALQALDATTNGTVEMCHTASYYYFGKDPTFAFGTNVPFGLNSRMNTAWLTIGGGGDLMNDFYKKFNVVGVVAGNTGTQMGGWFRKEINTVDDLKGLKMRIGGFGGTVIAELGAVPQQIAGGDIYPALEKGTLDAVEWVGPYDDEKLGFFKVAKYYYYPGWWEAGSTIHNFVNLDKWNALPKAYQSLIKTASAFANDWMMAKYDVLNPGALKRLVGGGVQLRPFTQPVMEACQKATIDVCHGFADKNADFKKAYDSMIAFRNDSYLWWQVAEATNDAFMIRNRTKS